jgi:hypothetical protein
MDIKKIKPKVKGQSDKYSWNLYKFLEKQVKQRDVGNFAPKQLRVYWLHHSFWDGSYLEFNPNKLNHRQIIISPFGGKGSGYFLSHILPDGMKKECYALSVYHPDEFSDITNWFFTTYERDGRCIFDREHSGWWSGEENRFTYINNTRRCNWCGQWHKKEIHKIVKIKREEVWV